VAAIPLPVANNKIIFWAELSVPGSQEFSQLTWIGFGFEQLTNLGAVAGVQWTSLG
jgi:hypothetical protein